jgi:hypothetical protein
MANTHQTPDHRDVDVFIAGGGTGGFAAALAAAQAGCTVVVSEPTDWLGGQLTAQGVSAPDEHQYIETCGGTRSYYAFRNAIREYYKTNYQLSDQAKKAKYLNPGLGWVSRLCFEPKVGVKVLGDMLAPYTDTGQVKVLYRSVPVRVEREARQITAVAVQHLVTEAITHVTAKVFLDATELGDLMPLAQVPFHMGMESWEQTGEPSAPPEGNREAIQSFTYTFAVEYCPGENHVIAKPALYDQMKRAYSFRGYKMFEPSTLFANPFWTYRRLIAADNFADPAFPRDIAMINWAGNDYTGGNIVGVPPALQEERLNEAKQLSLGFLYWLQTAAPRDDGGSGYPELKLRPDIMGTADGLSQYPYIREGRRLAAIEIVREQDLVVRYNPGPRARLMTDTVGLGLYTYIDVHHCCNTSLRPGSGQHIRPFQIPLRSLLTHNAANFIAAAKNIGVTHITNGAFRLHPTEWCIGEAAGTLAAFAVQTGKQPLAVGLDSQLLRQYQLRLVQRGVPLYWYTDVPYTHPAFEAIHYLGALRICDGIDDTLHFVPDEAINGELAKRWCKNAGVDLISNERALTRAEYAVKLYQALQAKEAAAR